MPATYEPIATTTLGSDQASVSFNSFSGYTDLILVANYGITNNGYTVGLQFNSDTGTNYSWTYVRGNGSTTLSYRKSSMVFASLADEVKSDNYNTLIINLQNYANSSTYKTILSRSGNAGMSTATTVSLWRSTSAITSFVFKEGADGGPGTFGTGNIKAGSTFTLYGIKAA